MNTTIDRTFVTGERTSSTPPTTATSQVVASPPSGSPSEWTTEVVIDHVAQTVVLRTRAAVAVFECTPSGYAIYPASVAVAFVDDLDVSRIGQRLWFDSTLPSTDGREFPVTLVSYTEPGTPRTLRFVNLNVAAPFGVEYIEGQFEADISGVWTAVAPRNGGVYHLNISFRQL